MSVFTTCPGCRAELSGDAKFCPSCGSQVAGDRPPACPHCGRSVKAGVKHCPHCGASQTLEPQNAPTAVDLPPPMPPVPMPAPVRGEPAPMPDPMQDAPSAPASGSAPTVMMPPRPLSAASVPPTLSHPAATEQQRKSTELRSRRRWWLLLPILAVVAAGAMVALSASGSRHSAGSRSQRDTAHHSATIPPTAAQNVVTTSTAPGSMATSSAAPSSVDGPAVVAVLNEYEAAYTEHRLPELAGILAPAVTRQGLGQSGCTFARGRAAVMAEYRFEFGRVHGPYQFVGLTPEDVTFDAAGDAQVATHFLLANGVTGQVSFTLQREASGWKIAAVRATCSPSRA